MILSDKDVRERLKRGDLKIEPLEDHQIGPASVDIKLGSAFRVFKLSDHTVIDPLNYQDDFKKEVSLGSGVTMKRHEYTDLYEGFSKEKPFVLHPHDFVLGSSIERFEFPDDLGGKLEGRSSLGRIGLVIHSTAGWFDPGFQGTCTLEITNIGKIPIKLYPGMRVGQMVFEQMTSKSENPYNLRDQSKYSGQMEPTESRIGKDLEFNDAK